MLSSHLNSLGCCRSPHVIRVLAQADKEREEIRAALAAKREEALSRVDEDFQKAEAALAAGHGGPRAQKAHGADVPGERRAVGVGEAAGRRAPPPHPQNRRLQAQKREVLRTLQASSSLALFA